MSFYAGIDLGGTNIAVGIVNERYEIVSRAKRRTALPRSSKEIMHDAAEAVREAADGLGIGTDGLEWVGIGSPGIVNRDSGIIDYSCNLDFYDEDLKSLLTAELGLPVYMDNDANAAAYGEYVAGGAKGVRSAVIVTLGTGVGGGVIIDGKIYSGFNFAGAEIGHMVIERGGRECNCGRRGCFEAYCSATGLVRTTKEFMRSDPDSYMWELCSGDIEKAGGRTAWQAMRKGDRTGRLAVDQFLSDLACGITNLINIFAPEILCIGGGVSKEGDGLILPLEKMVNREVYSRFSKKMTKISVAQLGNDAGIIGAAALGMQYKEET